MGFFSSIGSGISSLVHSVGSFIGSAVSSIGAGVCSFAKSALSVVSKLPIPGLQIVNAISIAASVIHAVVSFLGIKSEQNPEVLGAKAQQCDKSMEDFDYDVEEYIKYLKEEVELDKEKFDKMSSEEKLGCATIGMSLETKAVEQKIGGIIIPSKCIGTIVKLNEAGINLEPSYVVKTINNLKQEGITNLGDVSDFLEGRGDSDRVKTGEAFSRAMGEGSTSRIMDLQDAVRKYEV